VPTHPYSPCLAHAPYSPPPSRSSTGARTRGRPRRRRARRGPRRARPPRPPRGTAAPARRVPRRRGRSPPARGPSRRRSGASPRDGADGNRERRVREQRDVDESTPRTRARPRAAPRAARRRPRRSTDCARPRRGFCGERRQVVARALVRRAERADRDRTDEADSNEKDDGAVEDDRPRRHHADRRVDRREQLGDDDRERGRRDDEQRRQHQHDDEQFGEKLQESPGALAGPVLPVREHPALRPEVLRERRVASRRVLAELQEERREQLSRGRVAGDPTQSLVEAPGESRGVERLP